MAADHFFQLLLGRDDDPGRGNELLGLDEILADLAELLHDRTQVFDLVVATGNVLAHFVDDQYQRLAGAATASKLEGSVRPPWSAVIVASRFRWECVHESAVV